MKTITANKSNLSNKIPNKLGNKNNLHILKTCRCSACNAMLPEDATDSFCDKCLSMVTVLPSMNSYNINRKDTYEISIDEYLEEIYREDDLYILTQYIGSKRVREGQ